MVEETRDLETSHGAAGEAPPRRCRECCAAPVRWLRMLASEMHWSFVVSVVLVYGVSQGMGGALAKVATEYYMKDVQKVQPSEAQIYTGITSIPWIIKPLWGILTDVLPIRGYRRRPYFVLGGSLSVMSMLMLSFHENLHLVLAILFLTAGSAGVAIADVTIDACAAQNSISHPRLAADIQSLCSLSAAIGQLLGFSISGVFVHLIGPKGVFGLLAIPAGLVFSVGIMLDEPQIPDFQYGQVSQKFLTAGNTMWTTLKAPVVWKPCLYMFTSLALSINIVEGMFYWYTDAKGGPSFSQEDIGFIFSIGSIGAFLGAVLYQNVLKDHPFRDLLFWTQLVFGISGMLDLVLVLRLNLRLGIPDYFFAVIDESVGRMVGRLKWMPLLVLSTKLCPSGIEGTFFALLMSIDNAGVLSASWAGGVLLHLLNVTRTKFDSLWLAILIRNLFRLSPLCLLFLVPRADPSDRILPEEIAGTEEENDSEEQKNTELVPLVNNIENSRSSSSSR